MRNALAISYQAHVGIRAVPGARLPGSAGFQPARPGSSHAQRGRGRPRSREATWTNGAGMGLARNQERACATATGRRSSGRRACGPRGRRPPPGNAPAGSDSRRETGRRGSRPVSRVLSRAAIHLGRASPRASSDLPGSGAGHASRSPIWSCSRWGLPCHRCCHRRGALLPHLFTLARYTSGRFVFCGTFRGLAPPRRYLAPCPSEPGLSSPPRARRSGCPADSRPSSLRPPGALRNRGAWPWRGPLPPAAAGRGGTGACAACRSPGRRGRPPA